MNTVSSANLKQSTTLAAIKKNNSIQAKSSTQNYVKNSFILPESAAYSFNKTLHSIREKNSML